MIDFNIENIEELNTILRSKKKGLKKIAQELYNTSPEELTNELEQLGYIKFKANPKAAVQFVRQDVGQSVGQDVGQNKAEVIVLPQKDNVVPLEKENYSKLMSNFDILMEMIEKYKKNNEIPKSDIVVQLPYESNKNYKTSIRIHKEVFEEFKLFCSKHKEFSQKELISMALVEYINKYN